MSCVVLLLLLLLLLMAESKSSLRTSPAKECLEKVRRWLNDEKSSEQLQSLIEATVQELQGKEKNVFRASCEQIQEGEKSADEKVEKARLQRRVEEKIHLFDVYQSVWNGEETLVREYLSLHPSESDQSGPYGTTFLYSAARNNHLSLLRYLVEEAKCSVNVGNEGITRRGKEKSSPDPSIGSTALHAACYQGFLPLCQYLVHHGADYYLLNGMNETPIHNGRSQRQICQFFADLLLPRYSLSFADEDGEGVLPHESVLTTLEKTKTQVRDSLWEYLSADGGQWFRVDEEEADLLHQAALKNSTELKKNHVEISLRDFSRRGKDRFEKEKFNWIRSRGSAMKNFGWAAQWQVLIIPPSPASLVSREILSFPTDASAPQFFSWYECPPDLNWNIERAMNYHRRYISLFVPSLSSEKLFFDLEHFHFFTRDRTFSGHLRWIRHPQPLKNLHSLLQSPINEEQADPPEPQLFPSQQVSLSLLLLERDEQFFPLETDVGLEERGDPPWRSVSREGQ